MVVRIGGERGTHRFFRYVSCGERRQVAAGDECRDRDEVLAVGLHGVRRRFPGLTIIQELSKPLRERIDLWRFGFRINTDTRRRGIGGVEPGTQVP
jgi:hypothetical protein